MGEVSGIPVLFSPSHFLHHGARSASTIAATDSLYRAGHCRIPFLCRVPEPGRSGGGAVDAARW